MPPEVFVLFVVTNDLVIDTEKSAEARVGSTIGSEVGESATKLEKKN